MRSFGVVRGIIIQKEAAKEDGIKMKWEPYSVLMSVYALERVDHLAQSIESMLRQTVPPSDFVLVCDGPLTTPLNTLIASYTDRFPGLFQIVRLAKRGGVGAASNAGLPLCREALVARMDADDIALPDRCEKQLLLFSSERAVGLCGGYVEEFDSQTGRDLSTRRVPETHDEIIRFCKRRNPFNNPTLMFKKDDALSIGGYSPERRCEDYDFVARMIISGVRCRNIPHVLVRYRVSVENLRRRRNWPNTRSFILVRWNLYRRHFSGAGDFLISCLAQLALFACPVAVTQWFYERFLR